MLPTMCLSNVEGEKNNQNDITSMSCVRNMCRYTEVTKVFHVSCTQRHATRKECTSVAYNFIDISHYVTKFRHHNFQNMTC